MKALSIFPRFIGVVVAMLLASTGFSQLRATFDHTWFYVPDQTHVLEIYLDFHGPSIEYQTVKDSLYQGKVQATLILQKGEEIIDFDKSEVTSPLNADSIFVDFIHQHRFAVQPGDYVLEVQLDDMLDDQPAVTSEVNVRIPENEDKPFFSLVERVSGYKKTTEQNKFSKAGYDLLPMASDLYQESANLAVFYTELYNVGEALPEGQDKFLLTYYVQKDTADGPIASTRSFKREKAAEVVPILRSIPIEGVESGKYELVVEAKTPENELIARRTMDFRRYNPGNVSSVEDFQNTEIDGSFVASITNGDSLYFYVQSLSPIASESERNILQYTFADPVKSDVKMMQRFFYSFWLERDPIDPASAWKDYRKEVLIAENQFSTQNKHGFETDRGRVYLEYGPPDDIVNRPAEPSSYPYQIWRYYKAGKFNNVRFVFYDRDLVMNDYELLHADNIRGEIRNPRWQLLLQRRNNPLDNVDDTQPLPSWGSNVDELFENPR